MTDGTNTVLLFEHSVVIVGRQSVLSKVVRAVPRGVLPTPTGTIDRSLLGITLAILAASLLGAVPTGRQQPL